MYNYIYSERYKIIRCSRSAYVYNEWNSPVLPQFNVPIGATLKTNNCNCELYDSQRKQYMKQNINVFSCCVCVSVSVFYHAAHSMHKMWFSSVRFYFFLFLFFVCFSVNQKLYTVEQMHGCFLLVLAVTIAALLSVTRTHKRIGKQHARGMKNSISVGSQNVLSYNICASPYLFCLFVFHIEADYIHIHKRNAIYFCATLLAHKK